MASTEEGRALRRQIKTLERRRDFLGQRLALRPSDNDSNFDRAEYIALGSALHYMRHAYDNLPKENRPEGQKGDK